MTPRLLRAARRLPAPVLLMRVLVAGVLLVAGTSATRASGIPASVAPPAPVSAPPPAFAACLERLRTEAVARGVPASAAERHLSDLERDPSVLEALDFQPEFRTPIWDYLAGLVDDERIADGQAMLGRWADALAVVEARYGVDRHVVVAVWGVETDFGRAVGRRPIVRSLATLSCEGRRQTFFRGQLFAALRILADGHVEPERFTGSWAGAFGHTQFMPTTFLESAVDFDGDGRRDVVGTIPDALASTAHYLKRAGWRPGEPWGWEVRLGAGFDASRVGRTQRRPLDEWAARGVRRVDGAPLPASASPAAVLLPAGRDGPAFLVRRNFDALYAYNAAETYALAIAHLSDRLRGGGPFAARWPTDDPGLSRAQRREVQRLLLARGHAIGEVDGMIGSVTRGAIRDEQTRLGMQPDGRAGMKLLEALRRDTRSAAR